MIRTIRPTDLVVLVAFEGKAYPNSARTRDRLEQDQPRPLTIGTILEQWITLENRHTLVAAEGNAIQGLVSARHRAGPTAWEVDWLVLKPEERAEQLLEALLGYLAERASGAGVRRIFLRLQQESPFVTAARRVGFWPYLSEALFRRELAEGVAPSPPVEHLRPRLKGDEQGIFRLYHAAVPQTVRTVEGMTLQEWGETQDPSFGHQKEYVCAREDPLYAWLRLIKGSGWGQFQLLVHPGEEGNLRPLVHYALSGLGKREAVLALVPDFQSSLQSILVQEWGFEATAHYYTLVRQLAVPVKEGRLVLARA